MMETPTIYLNLVVLCLDILHGLNDLRKINCLRKSEFYVKKSVCKVKDKLVEHGIYTVSHSNNNRRI